MVRAGYINRTAYYLYRYFWGFIDWLFPPECAGCGQAGVRWCEDCHQSAQIIQPPFCPTCGIPLAQGSICTDCQRHPTVINGLRSWAVYSGAVRDALHSMKYQRNLGIGEIFAETLGNVFDMTGWHVDMVVPVPIGKERLKERGYNQAALVAYPFALAQGIPYKPSAMKRIKETRSQVKMTADDRRINVQNAFLGVSEIVEGKSVLIIDDIATTCSTMDSCAKALLNSGASKVYGLTVARAVVL